MYESVNKIYFRASDYNSLDEMHLDIASQLKSLTQKSYMCLLYRYLNDANIYVLEFASLNPLFNKEKVVPCWLTTDEAKEVAAARLADAEDLEEIVNDSLRINSNKGGGNNA